MSLRFKLGILLSLIFLIVSIFLVNIVIDCFRWLDGMPSYCIIPSWIFIISIFISVFSGYSPAVVYVTVIVNAFIGFLIGWLIGKVIEKKK